MAATVESNIIVLDDEEEGLPPPIPREPPGPAPASPQPNGTPTKKPDPLAQHAGSFKAENERLFGEFLECCSRLTEEHPEVIPFLASRHQKASTEFLASAEFRNVLGRCLTRVQSKRSKVYVYINELCTVLKAHTQRRKLALSSAPAPPTPYQQEPVAPEGEGTSGQRGTGSKRQIRYLENLLRVYMGEIRRLQERELDLAELDSEDSTYLQESRLKRKMMHIFERLCQLKQCSSLTGRVIEQRIPYRGTRYPEVNRRIERFINRPDVFPDYTDILKVIQKASARHSLGLAKRQMQSMALDAFREVGNRLQERRHLDLVYNFGSHLTDQYRPDTDPARRDSALARRLRENREVALTRLDSVVSRYAQLQDESEEEERVRKRAAQARGNAAPRQEGLLPLPCPMAPDPGAGQPHTQGSPSASTASQGAPVVSEEEEDDDDSEAEEPSSDTDIEEELQQSQEGGEEEEEDAVMQDAEAAGEDTAGDQEDQCMELGLEPLPCSSGGEDLEDEEDEEDEEEDEEEEPLPLAEGEGLPSPKEGPPFSPVQELFVLEIEALPLELSETPPPSPQIPGGSEATPKATPSSPEPSEATPLGSASPETVSSQTEQEVSPKEPASFAVKQEGGGMGDSGLRTQPPAKKRQLSAPRSPLARPLENGGSIISSTSFNGSAGPPACKRGRQELPCGNSCLEVHSIGSEDEDLELPLDSLLPRSPLPDSTRADSPFQSLVSSSQGSPQLCQRLLPKTCKTSVATQCDPEEIIILSDSD
ncbi:death domain-associated protein 6 isoform X2 [Dermochelys coriacea]|uniref:death domain-associated protein 6 isoform X2 n=1 Tax=Dermochelys coriacea TaxID=27794 RepID=UPI0018E81FEF|nr:death domain-associated protein 6 isoform X2 [Dermochelys coriacea]XP_043353135.1 death domain-associated protein 6 isoform X2 [Dermochelys coriacea]